jgi:hypothetical protein
MDSLGWLDRLFKVGGWLRDASQRTPFGSRREVRGRLNRLFSGITRVHLEELFGPAVAAGVGPNGETELLFPTRHALVGALDSASGGARALYVTVTDPKLKYRTKVLTAGLFDIQLGTETFAKLPEPDARSGFIAATGYAYYEYFGPIGAANDLSFALSYTIAGTGDLHVPAGSDDDGFISEKDPAGREREQIDELRRGTTVNTLAVFGPWVDAIEWPSRERDQLLGLSVASVPSHLPPLRR